MGPWLKQACPCGQRAPLQEIRPRPAITQQSQRTVTDAPHLPLVTCQKRRRLVRAQHCELRKRRKLDQGVAAEVARVLHIGTPSACTQGLEVTATLPPIHLHSSHTYVLCGGYAGCVKCGGVVGYARPSLLSTQCREHCPAGSRRSIRRLAQGLLPKPVVDGAGAWPTGELNPKVCAYRPPSTGSG
eukprot:9550815-Karenia_brevis.AAC.1